MMVLIEKKWDKCLRVERERARDYSILIIIIIPFTFFSSSPQPSFIRISYIMMVNEFTEALWCVDAFHSNLSFGYVSSRVNSRED